jgi:hypothetical protein
MVNASNAWETVETDGMSQRVPNAAASEVFDRPFSQGHPGGMADLGWWRTKFPVNRGRFRLAILFSSGFFILDALMPGHSWQGRLLDLVTVALCLALGLCLLRMGVQVEPKGVIIRNAVGTQRLPWKEVDRFELRRFGRFKKGTLAAARLRDGQVLRIDGSPFDVLATTPLRDLIHGRNLAAEPLVDELNRALRDHVRSD